jgi:glycosyltransferase involved in cell wall biosynthesis
MKSAKAERPPYRGIDSWPRFGRRAFGRFRRVRSVRAGPVRLWGPIRSAVRSSLSIVLPALNEEAGIEAVMARIPRTILRGKGLSWSINLLDGRSTDRTRAVATRLGAEVFIQSGHGKGAAFREFIPSIREDVTVLLDSDGTYPPEAIPDLLEALGQDHAVVLGSRLRGTIEPGAMSEANYLGNRLLSWFASIIFGTRISDVCSGMWAFESDRLKSLDLSANGFDLEADLFAECALRRIPIVEVPIRYERRIGRPKLRLTAGFRIAYRLLKKRLRAGSRLALEDAVNPTAWTEPAEGSG